MKLWFENCSSDYLHEDSNVKFGVGWYRHSKKHKWWGITVELYLFKHVVMVNYVSNWYEYDKKINFKINKK